VAEIDAAASTGKVPPALLSRWEEALEDVGLFRFHSTVIHGGINQESIFVQNQSVAGIGSWSALSIADPAEDLRYLAADENIMQRAILYSEIELASWLSHCVQLRDEELISEAEAMLQDLADQLTAGTLRSLRAAGFVGLGAAASTAPVSQLIEPQISPADSDELF
jgi:aminoglycoside phosphotransferase (APT) family kinase protein